MTARTTGAVRTKRTKRTTGQQATCRATGRIHGNKDGNDENDNENGGDRGDKDDKRYMAHA